MIYTIILKLKIEKKKKLQVCYKIDKKINIDTFTS